MTPASTRRVVVVTGGGAGIGAGIAEELGRRGDFVVTLDANVSLDGASSASATGPSTADRIVAGGGEAMAAELSVTDAEAVRGLFDRLVREQGSLDVVVNVAGISRPTSFSRGSEDDWRAVLDVHLEGYLMVLRAALPIMARAGRGRIVGVTSGSGWRAADAGAYSCAKRAVAALTWQLGRNPPPGVTVNALSPIAATRMVTESLRRAQPGSDSASAASGGIVLTGFPPSEALGPVGAYVASEQFAWCSGRILFTGAAELTLIDEPRLLEAVRSRPVASLPETLEATIPDALVPAEKTQATGGGATARFSELYDAPSGDPTQGSARCLVVSDEPSRGASVVAALASRGATAVVAQLPPGSSTFDVLSGIVGDAAAELEGLDAVVSVVDGRSPYPTGDAEPAWSSILADHDGLPGRIYADAALMRAVADYSATSQRATRFVGLIDATSPGGRTRAQSAAQLSRASIGASDGRVCATVVGCESDIEADFTAAADLAAHLVVSDDATELSGAELCVGVGWIGLRSHPAPAGTVNFGGPELPDWVDAAMRRLLERPTG